MVYISPSKYTIYEENQDWVNEKNYLPKNISNIIFKYLLY